MPSARAFAPAAVLVIALGGAIGWLGASKDPLAAAVTPRGSELTDLVGLAQDAASFAERRRAHEALERFGETKRLDRFDWLSTQLHANGTERCSIRKWYVDRLIALEDPRAVAR